MAIDRSNHYKHNEVLVLMGCDFQYIDSAHHYQNMDRLISYINSNFGGQYHAQYSTPSDYVKAVHSYDIAWPTRYDDMFPYADIEHQYWTGYFTSRPNNKAYIRELSHQFHSATQMYSLTAIDQTATQAEIDNVIDTKNQVLDKMGILSHHDAVTGTGKQRTADDYSYKAWQGVQANNPTYS
jgi:hypothetical protein